ncbi:hypothetical protein COCON_G00173530 [Conger conger]|uniref:Uncharacterized protein n=1 Tax=Conger conger TaxID=82655 RepID=A0A9Q1HSK4_CONCO|nr:hypothetical protein COCON_G00173530 [Conger conger]
MCRKMPDVLLVFSAIALTLSSVTPASGLPSNTHGIKSFENIWDSEWVAPRSSRQQTVMPSTDYTHFLAKGSPYSTSMAWPDPDAQVQCGAKNMTLQISRLGTSPLHVNTSDSWVTLFQKLPQCSRATSRHRRSVWPPYHACDFSQQAGPATFPVRVAGTPLVVGCPYPPRGPPVECSEDLQLRLGGVSVSSLKMKVMGHWYPLMTICKWCRLSMELQGGELSIKSPLKGPCTEMLGGQHAISIRSGDAEMAGTSLLYDSSPPPLQSRCVAPPPGPLHMLMEREPEEGGVGGRGAEPEHGPSRIAHNARENMGALGQGFKQLFHQQRRRSSVPPHDTAATRARAVSPGGATPDAPEADAPPPAAAAEAPRRRSEPRAAAGDEARRQPAGPPPARAPARPRSSSTADGPAAPPRPRAPPPACASAQDHHCVSSAFAFPHFSPAVVFAWYDAEVGQSC